MIGLHLNPFFTAEELDALNNEKISLTREGKGPLQDFEKVVVHDKERDFTLPAFFISHTIFEKCVIQIGFEKFKWIPMRTEGEHTQKPELAVFLQGRNYPQISFEAYKPISSKIQKE